MGIMDGIFLVLLDNITALRIQNFTGLPGDFVPMFVCFD